MRNIPTLKFSYGHLLLARIYEFGSATILDLLGKDPSRLFKSEGQFDNPERRARDCLRYAQMLGLAVENERTWELTAPGTGYAAEVSPSDPWIVNDLQAEIIRSQLSGGAPLAEDAQIALEVVSTLPAGFSSEDLGRALADRTNTKQWQANRTFEAQGARYWNLLRESGLINKSGALTEHGVALLGPPPAVWWVNQGDTYTRQRDGGFLWAPYVNRAGRAEYHWDTMDEVHENDAVLHYNSGLLRAVSRVAKAARPARNPARNQTWAAEGRLIETRYEELNEPIPLSAIDLSVRISHGAPFTTTGSVQQIYLVRLKDEFVRELAERFPELAKFLASDRQANPMPRSPHIATPKELLADFERVVDESGLRFPPGSNIVRSFLSSLLAKPFAILTGLAGSGKTQLAMRLGEWFGTDKNGRHRHATVPVRPDWNGPESIFGYEDALRTSASGAPVWIVPEAFELILRATRDPEYPYLLILDEMNLAQVERYFSDFLSGVESRRPVLPDLLFDQESTQWVLRDVEAQKLPLPRNLFVVGTVNVDESTYMFSPKVLDRAFTFEFRVTADELDADLRRPTTATAGGEQQLRAFTSLAASDDWQQQHPHPAQTEILSSLREAHTILAGANQEFGHRTLYEILRFSAYFAATGDDNVSTVLDLAIMQKLLPKVHGSRRRVEPILGQLAALARGAGPAPRLPISHQKIGRMLETVRANQFVSFSE